MTQRILVIEDETEIANYLRRGLAMEGFEVAVAYDGLAGVAAAREQPPDLVILDRMLPKLDGLAVAERLRTVLDMPILMLTAKSEVGDRVAGLEHGADDYLVKPFAWEELLARIKALLRRHQRNITQDQMRSGPLRMDLAAHEVYMNDRVVALTAKEFDLLAFFMQHPNHVLGRDQIYEHVWGYDFGSDSNMIEVYMRNLRQKLEAGGEPRLLDTVRNVGYVLRDRNTG